jgi:hypothetical protein
VVEESGFGRRLQHRQGLLRERERILVAAAILGEPAQVAQNPGRSGVARPRLPLEDSQRLRESDVRLGPLVLNPVE